MYSSPRLCRRRERRLIEARFGRWREEIFGRARCLTLQYSLLLPVWVDQSTEHIISHMHTSRQRMRSQRIARLLVLKPAGKDGVNT